MRRAWTAKAAPNARALARRLSAGLAIAALGACADEALNPERPATSDARPLGIYEAERAEDPRAEARRAFERDARRRETRFVDAALPGYLRSSSRPEQIEIESGVWSPSELYQLGAQLFHHDFTRAEGLGGSDVPYPSRFGLRFRGEVATASCRSCHVRGGVAGAGDAADNAYLQGDGEHQSVALERNAPALLGAGWVELAARELSSDLAEQRASAVVRAMREGREVRIELTTQGIAFGGLRAQPDGHVDVTELRGIDGDLVVRPFGRKGTFATLREAVEDELASRLGLQSGMFVERFGGVPARVGPSGGDDPDGDGVVDEVTEGEISALTLMVAMQEIPVVELADSAVAPNSLWAEGRSRFEEIGCAACHVPSLSVSSGLFTLPSREGGAEVVVDLEVSGATPRLSRGAVDGRLTLELHDAIVLHGGEASEARDRYVDLGEAGQAPIRVFLLSLTRAPHYAVP